MNVLRSLLVTSIIFSGANAAVAQDKPQIVAVNYALQYFAERLVGDAVEVVFPVPQDVDPSFWRPSIADISMIQSADLILLNGAGFATWVDRVSLPRSKLVNTTAGIEDQFIVTESITHSHGDGGTHSHEGLASYTWLDPTLAIAQAEAIATAITRRDLAPTTEVEARLATLRADLEALDATASASLADAQGVSMIATHPRYEYFARRYGLSISALEWEAGAMPTVAEFADLQALVQETDAGLLIWEAVPPAGADEAAAGLNLKSAIFTPLAHQNGTQTYLETFAEAVSTISSAASQ